jgi:hypothetical protein
MSAEHNPQSNPSRLPSPWQNDAESESLTQPPQFRWNPYGDDPYHPDPYGPR